METVQKLNYMLLLLYYKQSLIFYQYSWWKTDAMKLISCRYHYKHSIAIKIGAIEENIAMVMMLPVVAEEQN